MVGLDRLLAALDVAVGSFAISDVVRGRRACTRDFEGATALYVLAGSGRITAAGCPDAALSADTLGILPCGFDGRIEPDASSAFRLVVVSGGVRATFGEGAGLFDSLKTPLVECFADRPLRDSFLLLTDELSAPSVGTQALTETILKQALILLMRRQSRLSADASHPLIAALRDGRLAPALSAMLDRPADPLSLDALARLAGMSRSVFAERFAAAFGRPPIEFLKDVRLGHAARLLATTDMPVKKIARAVGYESRSYFSRAFRNRYTVDPSDYRLAGIAAE